MSPTLDDEQRKKRIDELLLMIGGFEASIFSAQEQNDWDFVKQLKPLRQGYIERLRRVVYGLPEERTSTAKNAAQ